jgi:N-glycosylase/DNA lyase
MSTRADHRIALHEALAERGDAIRKRLDEFAAVDPSAYFYELLYCLLTPQSSAVNAHKVIAILQNADALRNDLPLAEILASREHYIRFHNTKARRITEMRSRYEEIHSRIVNTPDSLELRAWLVDNVKGLGWKESSHFLRNIGRRNLAILDRHILRNLVRYRVIRSMPRTLTPSRYLSIEQSFLRFAAETGIPLDELDLLFWSGQTGMILK